MKSLHLGYTNVVSALKDISDDNDQNSATRHDANCLLSSLETLEYVIMLDLWYSILSRFNATSEKLQSTNCDLKLALNMLSSLVKFLEDMRSRFNEVEARCIAQSGISEYHSFVVRRRKRNTRYDDNGHVQEQEDVALTPKERFKVETYLVIIDQLISCLNARISAYDEVKRKFQVLIEFKTLPLDDVRSMAKILADSYPDDLDSTVFADEMIQLTEYVKASNCEAPADIAKLLHSDQLQETFPNVCVGLRIYLSLMVSNCSGERSFSKRALIKNKMRSTMGDRRLSALELLSLESDVLESITFDKVIEQFALTKSRTCLK